MTVQGLAAPVQAATDLVAPAAPSGSDPAKAAQQFEGMLMGMLFQQLRKTVQPSGLFGGNATTRQTYEYLLDQAVVTQAMEGGRTWGLKDRIEASIRAAQGK